jgi:pyruvate dehydrogenase E2 component (dihydrolipoamide acetyltransferase)
MTAGIYPVTVPKWGIEMQEGTVVTWHAEEGSDISAGDELIDVETDKIVNTMEAPMSGILRRRLVEKGETLQVGALLGVIATADIDDGTIEAFIGGFKPVESVLSQEDSESAAVQAAPVTAPQQSDASSEAAQAPARRVRISPAAAQRARELGVDISMVTGAGRRISPQDVERYASEHQAAEIPDTQSPAYEALPLGATRKTIASRLVEAKQQIPHFYLTIDINMDAALERRVEINTQAEQKVSLNDVVMRAVVIALQSVPDVNIHLVQDEIRRFGQVHLAMAVATDRGIITPVIHKADALTIAELAKEAVALGERARDASLTREDLDGGTFTVSNLGMYGISEFQAIINPPQGAILALGACEARIVPGPDGARSASVMRATLSCDHRAIDGALGAQFLAELKAALQNPVAL